MSRLEEIEERLDGAYYEGSTITDDISYLLSKLDIAQRALDNIMKIELTQDGETMYMNILDIRNIVGIARMKIRGTLK